jgi:uncharacterized damage-inducible protein DinB
MALRHISATRTKECTMIAQSMLGEFDHEMSNLRKVLERVPEDKPAFAPHPKSMPMATLAGHLAELAGWLTMTLKTDELDFGAGEYKPFAPATRAELLARFDEGVASARAALAGATDDQMMSPWTLKNGATVYFTMPRVAVIRGMVLNHIIHHRAQLGVYLRMNDIPLPGMYGPSADDPGM